MPQDDGRLPDSPHFAFLEHADDAHRVRLLADLAEVYYLSSLEDVHQPPGTKNYGRRDAFLNERTGREFNESFRGQRGKIALWIMAHAGSGPHQIHATIRANNPIVAGSPRLRKALASARSTLGDLLAKAPDDVPEDTAVAQLAVLLAPDFAAARSSAMTAVASGTDVTPKPKTLRLPTPSSLKWLLLNALIVSAAVYLTLYLPVLHARFVTLDAGTAAHASAALLVASSVAALPPLLALFTLSLLSWVSRHSQDKSIGAGGIASTAGNPPGGPSGHARSREKFTHAYSTTTSSHSDVSSSRLKSHTLPLLTFGLFAAPDAMLALPLCSAFMVVSSFFMIGAHVVGVDRPPSASLRSAAAPLLLLRPCASSAVSSVTWPLRAACRVAGGQATRIRNTPRAILTATAALTVIMCLGYHEPSPAPEATPPHYRSTAEWHDANLTVFNVTNPKAAESLAIARTTQPSTVARAGRALINKRDTKRPLGLTDRTYKALLNRRQPQLRGGRIHLVLDSGCTMTCHPYASDLINHRPSNETMSGIDGKPKRVKLVGDLPVVARDKHGKLQKLILRNVRCVPDFTDTLVSVDQMWEESSVEVRFANHRKIYVPDGKGKTIIFPFMRQDDGLYVLPVVHSNTEPSTDSPRRRSGLAFAAEAHKFDQADFHRAQSSHHLTSLSADDLAAHLHHRLHLSPGVIARLPRLTKDVSNKVSEQRGSNCRHCVEANATKLPHRTNDVYRSSYAGRLVHGDLVGPFKVSAIGFFKYALVLVDDHTRYKFVYFLQKKSDAPKIMRKFVSSLNAHLNRGAHSPKRHVGSLHLDNAGEFLSREFDDLLDDELIDRTTCPPYVHSLNGVAERAIRSIVENARSHMVASNCPIGFWPYAFEHAVDILNRSTGPPNSEMSAFELLEGTKPRILSIQPLGCRTVVVRPRHTYSKTTIDPRGLLGINLGRSPDITNGYRVWIPSQHKVLVSSEVYFDSTFMPWRAEGDQRVGPVAPVPSPQDDHPPGLRETEIPPRAADQELDVPTSFDLATRRSTFSARSSNRALVLCSGPYSRQDGLGAFINKFGMEATLVDNDAKHGGGQKHDLLNDAFFHEILTRVESGDFCAIFAAPPCSTFSISRFFSTDGPPPVRNRQHIHGLPDVPDSHRRELLEANALVARMCRLLSAARKVGAEFIVENPSDRGDRSSPRGFLTEDHGSIWQMDEMKELAESTGSQTVNFCQCRFGADWQKRTTLLYTPGFDQWLAPLRELECNHQSHAATAGGAKDDAGEWISKAAAAYPPELNFYLAKAIVSIRQRAKLPTTPVTERAERVSERVESEAAVDDEPAPEEAAATTVAPVAPSLPVASPIARPRVVAPPSAPRSLGQLNHLFDDAAGSPSPRRVSFEPPNADAVEPTRERRPKRERRPASYWQTREPIQTRAAGRALLLFSGALVALSPWSGGGLSYKASAGSAADPSSRKEALAMDAPGWTASMDEEMENHHNKGSWEWVRRVDVPRNRHLVKLVWVFKVKRDGRLKSRLCVQGCAQTAGVDYDQTWSGALRSTSLRSIASLAAHKGLRLHRWDFVSAYLQGDLEPGEVVYCAAAPGYERTDSEGYELCCRVVRPVYGMAQAGRRWQRSFFPWLRQYGFTQCESDSCLWHLTRGKERLVVGVYVDDLACAYESDAEGSLYHHFVTELQKRWSVEDEGELTDLLGIDFTFNDGTVTLAQPRYIDKLCATYGVTLDGPNALLPHDKALPQLVEDGLSQASVDPDLLKRYQSIVGALLYCATNTRPDVAFAVGMLCRAMSKPTPALYAEAERAMRYLLRTRELGLRYQASRTPAHGYSDSDWAVKHSTSGYVFVLNRAAVSWASKKQKCVALSSCEAEIMAASTAAQESVYVTKLCNEIGMPLPDPMELHVDNKSAIDVAYNPEHHGRMKHVARKHFYVRELVEDHKLRVTFVRSVDNLSDIFTKPLPAHAFFPLRDAIMNVPLDQREGSGA